MGGGGDTGTQFYDAALHRRQMLMGASGPSALVKNFKVFRIALFACIGGGTLSLVHLHVFWRFRESCDSSLLPRRDAQLQILPQRAFTDSVSPLWL